ncbi:SCP-like_extracellular protein [Hexamita inflata]|uniref:SCP-like_extracellular protein n=1 Tax=Hexamita inflata TaxID=28002 RepID=A0ABP1H154_9EUKA
MTMHEGSSGGNVTYLHYSLLILCFDPSSFSDYFGPNTTNAVKQYQAKRNFTVDGVVDTQTWSAIQSEIQSIQQLLSTKGYLASVDSLAGPITLNAVKKFQTDNGLNPDGQACASTMSRLNISVTPLQSTPSAYVVTMAQLQQLGWNKLTNAVLADLNSALQFYQISGIQAIRHFISQCAQESTLGYYTVEIADGQAYEGRQDLGNIYPGDGPKFKGAGYIQLTGRYNYQAFANSLGDQKVMGGCQYVASTYPWKSAGFWWNMNGMTAFCNNGATVEEVTKKVNGGYNHLEGRKAYYKKCVTVFTETINSAPGPVYSWNLKNGVIRILFNFTLDPTTPTAASFTTSGTTSGTASQASIKGQYVNITFTNFANKNSQSLTYDPKKATIPLKSSKGELVQAFTIKPNTKRYSLKSDQFEAEVINLVNKLRASKGFGKLRVAANISAIARIKADDMVVNNYFSHTSPVFGDFSSLLEVFQNPFTMAAGENIAAGQTTPQDVFNSWSKSPGHYENMISQNYAHIGVGYNENMVTGYRGAWVQEFGFYKGNAKVLVTDAQGKPVNNTKITLGNPKDFSVNQTYLTDKSGKFSANSILFDSWEVYVGTTFYKDVKVQINADTGSITQTIKLNPNNSQNMVSESTKSIIILSIGISVGVLILLIVFATFIYARKTNKLCFKTKGLKIPLQQYNLVNKAQKQTVQKETQHGSLLQSNLQNYTNTAENQQVHQYIKPRKQNTAQQTQLPSLSPNNKTKVIPAYQMENQQNFNEVKAKYNQQTYQ